MRRSRASIYSPLRVPSSAFFLSPLLYHPPLSLALYTHIHDLLPTVYCPPLLSLSLRPFPRTFTSPAVSDWEIVTARARCIICAKLHVNAKMNPTIRDETASARSAVIM